MKNKVSFLIFLFSICVFSSTARAQVMLEQSKVVLEVKPGTTVTDYIVLRNTSDGEITLKIYWQDFRYVAPFDGKKEFRPIGTLPNSAAGWVSFVPSNVTLPPFATQKINYTIKVPADAHGGYYGVLFVEKSSLGSFQGQKGVEILARVGSLFFIETENNNKSSSIKDIKLDDSTISGAFSNLGDVILIPEGVYYVMDQDGLVVDRGQIDKFYLPPDETTGFNIFLSDTIQPGRYTTIITFDLGSGISVVKEVDFEKNSDLKSNLLQIRD